MDTKRLRSILEKCFSGNFAGGDFGNIPITPDKSKVDQAIKEIQELCGVEPMSEEGLQSKLDNLISEYMYKNNHSYNGSVQMLSIYLAKALSSHPPKGEVCPLIEECPTECRCREPILVCSVCKGIRR
jgi:hypothetical protein